MARYKAIGPDGLEHELEGPDGANDQEIEQAFAQAFPDIQPEQPKEEVPGIAKRFLSGIVRKPYDYPEDKYDIAGFAGKNIGAGIGGAVGTVLGTASIPVSGPAGPYLGAGAGAAMGKSWQNLAQQMMAHDPRFASLNIPRISPEQAIAEPVVEGATQVAFGKGTQMAAPYASQALQAVKPIASKIAAPVIEAGKWMGEKAADIGASFLRAYPNIRVDLGKAMLKDPSILWRWGGQKEVGAAYQAFEKQHNITGIGAEIQATGKVPSFDKLLETVTDVGNRVNAAKLANNPALLPSKQELYYASQASNALQKSMKGAGGAGPSEQAKSALAMRINELVGRNGRAIDEALESVAPGYKDLRTLAFESKVRRSTYSLLPENAGMSPNALRAVAAGAGLFSGNPFGVAFGMGVSPLIATAPIRAAGLAQLTAKGVAKMATSPIGKTVAKTSFPFVPIAIREAFIRALGKHSEPTGPQ